MSVKFIIILTFISLLLSPSDFCVICIRKSLEMNKTPEQKARANIDRMLERSGWTVVDKNAINWILGPGIPVREYQTDVGPADYVLFVDREPMGVIEAKKEEEGHRLSVHGQQAEYYAGRNQIFYCNVSTKLTI